MIRNKAPRYRNLQNLHVIPTAPTFPVVPVVQPSNVLITVQPTTFIPETIVTPSPNTSNKNFPKNMYSQNKPRNRKRNRKRKFSAMQTLVPDKSYNWFDSNYSNQESCPPSADNTQDNTEEKMNDTNEEADNCQEAPVEEDFEEVEVASVDAADDGEASAGEASVESEGKQEISVGFRRSKIHYLSYKNNFFKPKVYNFCSQRTLVNCLNIQDNCSVDVDVVSEADYEIEYDGEVLDQIESQDYVDKNEIEDEKVEGSADVNMENDSGTKVDKVKTKKVDVKIVKADNKSKNKVKTENVDVKTVKDDDKLKNKDVKEIQNVDHKSIKKDLQSEVKIKKNSTSVDVSSAKSNSTPNKITETSNSKGELNTPKKVSELDARSGKNNLTDSKNQNKRLEVNQVLLSSDKHKSIERVYKTSIENNDDIHQGKCAIQSLLDSWKSHLIGSEYLIEIQNNSNSSTMYNCILCSEDLEEKEFSSTNVISHINGRKHVVKFLEKHFPSCGLKFSDSSDYNFLVLQKMCEEINVKLGYSYMCITNLDFYKNHKKKIIDIVLNASHSSEESLKLSKTDFENKVESCLVKEINDVLNCLVTNIVGPDKISPGELKEKVPKESKSTLNVHKQVADSGAENKSKASYNEDKKKLSNTFKKCKGNSSLLSFLKLNAKANFKGSKPAKEPSTKDVKENVGTVSAVKEKAENVSAVKEKAENVSAVKEKAENVSAPKGKAENVSVVKEKAENVVAVKEKAKNVSPAKENAKSVSAAKKIPTNVSAVRENTKNIGAKKERNSANVIVKKEEIEIITIEEEEEEEEEEEVANEDLGTIPTQPIYQTGMAKDEDSNSKGFEFKNAQKMAMHSKHCRKRILGKDSRFKVAGKIKMKEESISDCFSAARAKITSVSESEKKSASNKLQANKKDMGFKDTLVVSSSKSNPLRKVTSVPFQKVSKADIKTPLNKYSKSSHPKIVHKKENETLKQKVDILVGKDVSSKWKPVTSTPKIPVNSSTSKPSQGLKSVPKHHSRSPEHKSSVERIVRDLSRSPVRRIKSPLRTIYRLARKVYRSPVRRHSRSPVRRGSRSPYRKMSKSPRRKSRSPKRHRSRSPLRRHSRSPSKRYSRSPVRRRSRSPVRRHSRSPVRRHSRSPVRQRSRSPVRRHSRSPVRQNSRSPMSRYSRSPNRWHSRSPSRRHSRSPRRRYSKSPGRQPSFSPIRRPLSPIKRPRSPVSKLSRSFNLSLSKSPVKEFRNIYKTHSPSIEHAGSIKDHMMSGKKFLNKYNLDKRMGQMSKEYVKMRTAKQAVSNISDKHKSHSFASSSMRGISDLDPVSDEDESVYFDKQLHLADDIMSSSSSKAVQFLQKFAVSNPNLDPSTIKQVMQFFESHKDELQQMMGSTSASKKEKININRQVSTNIQENILQQLLLSHLAGSSRESGSPSTPNLVPKYEQPQFLAENISPGYGLMANVSPHNIPQFSPSRVFPPNVNLPPPQAYGQLNQSHQELLQKTPPQTEGLFKDIKVTINKLFGANEMAQKQESMKSAVPGYAFQPSPDKWDLNPAAQKFSPHSAPNFSGHLNPRLSAPIDQKGMYHINPEGKNIAFNDASKSSVMRPDMPVMFNRNSNIPGQYLRGLDRQAQGLSVPPPDAKVSFCESPRGSSKGNLFPVVHNPQANASFSSSPHTSVSDVKVSLAQRLASVLVKVGMTDVPAPLLQEMLMKIGAFSSLPRQDITEAEIISILKRLGYLS